VPPQYLFIIFLPSRSFCPTVYVSLLAGEVNFVWARNQLSSVFFHTFNNGCHD
jgi:hypothetical protein